MDGVWKIKSITKTGTSISYTYDAAGNRISKTVNDTAIYYVRNARGNVSVYEKKDRAEPMSFTIG